MTILYLTDSRDSLKLIRETLCAAQTTVGNQHRERIQRVIAEIDRQRPLGPDGKHGDQHTPSCGCEPSCACVGLVHRDDCPQWVLPL